MNFYCVWSKKKGMDINMKTLKKVFIATVLATTMIAGGAGASDVILASPVEKVIIDSDFNSMGDDGQLFAMATQLMVQGKIELLGVTLVSGNRWLLQEEAEALKAVERMGVEKSVGVYAGADYPLHYNEQSIRNQQKSNPDGYFGAWMFHRPQNSAEVIAPSDGLATYTKLQTQSAVDFLIATIKKYPHQVTVLEIGPPTNLALALQKAPEIAPLLKQVIYMGGAMEVPGNANAVAELNWWFDPLAVSKVLHANIPQVVIPLDVTNKVALDKMTFDRITADPTKQTVVTKLYATANAKALEENTHIYDTLTIAYLLDPSYATKTVDAWLDVDTRDGETQGKVLVSKTGPTATSSKHKIRYVTDFDNRRFFELYVELLTQPVPVILPKK